MTAMPCDVVQEYEVPPGVTAVRIEAESSGSGWHSSSARNVADSAWRYPPATLSLFGGAKIVRGPRRRARLEAVIVTASMDEAHAQRVDLEPGRARAGPSNIARTSLTSKRGRPLPCPLSQVACIDFWSASKLGFGQLDSIHLFPSREKREFFVANS